jgi:hypothetical protein
MRQQRHASPSAQRGIGALVVVLVLFFILAMVALYTSRNLVFEQKTSANYYRSTQAFEAAESGVEWAIAMLNGGRVDGLCVGTVDTARDTFRDRHLRMDANFIHKQGPAGAPLDLHPSCVMGANGWICSCPTNAPPVLVAPAGTNPTPTFRITFKEDGPPGQSGLVRVISEGCSNFGTPCAADAAGGSDANATVSVLLGLAPSLTQTPAAALTVRGALTAGDALSVTNTDRATNGVTINAGGLVNAPNRVLATLPGNPVETSLAQSDTALSSLAPAGGLSNGEMMFLASFGMPPAAYHTQPAVVRLNCAVACDLQAASDQYPGRVIWIDGPLLIDAGTVVTLGSAASPVVLVVGGDITVGAGSTVTINGLVYSRGASMTTTGSNTLVQGAFIAEGVANADPLLDGSFRIVGTPGIVFDRVIVDHLSAAKSRSVMDFGAFVRVPGSWKDWKDNP